MFNHSSPGLEINCWSRNKMPYIANHQNLVSSTAATESVIRRLHSQDIKQHRYLKRVCGHAVAPTAKQMKETGLLVTWLCKFPWHAWELAIRISPQTCRLRVRAEAVGWYSGLEQLGTTRSPSLAKVPHKNITELVITCLYPTLHVFYFFLPLPIAKGQVLSREQNNSIYSCIYGLLLWGYYLCTTENPGFVYLEARLSEKLLLTEQKYLTVQFLDYSAKLAGSPARLRCGSDLGEQHRGKQQGPPKTLLLGLKNHSCSRVRGKLQHGPLGGGEISHGHFGRAQCFQLVCGPRPSRASTSRHGPSWRMNCEPMLPSSHRQCLEASPHAAGV